MTTYFDLAYAASDGNFRSFKSAFRLAMSEENAQRMLGILGREQTCQIFPPSQIEALLERTGQELQSRAGQSEPRLRYEVPRLVQLHCLFTAARRRGCAVAVWEDEEQQAGNANGLSRKRNAA